MINIAKAKTIKDKGIALCHESQGYSANLRPVSLLMKSDLAPEQITQDVVKALRQVTVSMSFEEFLRKFFYVYGSDAELLAKILGFETELERAAADNPDDEWLQAWNQENQEWLEERMESISIAKSANSGEEIDIIKQYEVLKLQQLFEKGVNELGVTFEETPDEVVTEDLQATGVVKNTGVDPVAIDKSKENKETSVSDTVDVTKSQAYLDIVKQLEEEKAKSAQAEEIIKAAAAVAKKDALKKAATFSFVEEAQHEAVADFILNKSNETFVTLLEKAQTRIQELETQVEDVKKEFGATENGLDAPTTTEDLKRSPEDILKANVAKALEKNKQ